MGEKKLKGLAKDAMAVQDACNLLAVINGWGRALKRLRELIPDWDEADRHPVSKLWADKASHLAGTQLLTEGDVSMGEAYSQVDKLARGRPTFTLVPRAK